MEIKLHSLVGILIATTAVVMVISAFLAETVFYNWSPGEVWGFLSYPVCLAMVAIIARCLWEKRLPFQYRRW